jgi:hypothetical protein
MPGDGFILIFWSWLFGLVAIFWFYSLSFEQVWPRLVLIASGIFLAGIAAYLGVSGWDEDYELANQIRAIAIVIGHVGLGGLVGTAIAAFLKILREK